MEGRPNFLGGNQFCRATELFGHHFYISILKIRRIKVPCHLLDFNVFYMIQQFFSSFSKFIQIKGEELNFSGGTIL